MDAVDLFRKLGAGAKFDFKRFGKDAERFKVARSQSKDVSKPLEGFNFFGINTREEAAVHDDENEEEESEEEQSAVTQKRKHSNKDESLSKPRKKQKANKEETNNAENKTDGGEEEELENRGIQWLSSQDKKAKGPKTKAKDKLSMKRLKQLHSEKVNQIRHSNRINVHGTDVPDPLSTFEELQKEYGLDPRIIQNIKAAGFQTPTPIQMQAIPLMMHRREILACAPTGSGKTMAFCLPLLVHLRQPLNKGFRALIVAPTRELASQTHRELLKLSEGVGFRVHMINKGVDAAKKYGPKSAKKFDILVTTPNRLIYLLNQDPPAVDLSSVEWLVVDESDKLFEDGKSGFRDQLATIFLACSSPKICRAFFSATFTTEVEKWCKLNLDNLVCVNIGPRNSAAETVEQELLFVGAENGKLLAMRDLIKKGFMPPMLVFVQSIERARELFHELVYEGINVDVIHADRTQQQRDNVISSFRSGKIWVLICTALMARGIDFKGVNLVVNYDFPTSAVEYIHRIGRTGRAGHKGKAITFFTEADKPLLRSIATVIKQAGCPVPDYMIGFKKIKSKVKRQLEKKPPRRSTIRTMPRFLIKKKPDKRKRKERKVEAHSKANGVKPEESTNN
ncbi:probable ATP-dependent RNA helicase DDX52 [Colossoma macropomum]|uniref:probable ATP-dependent RNA helicase DDX52 n=1 Tax=Colossoma macropomum TaxID=42526 RepID=UPI0018644289|nr:probable ATP-dependent RNA helicase DDX52 [Colossoma macropomum]